MSPPQNSSLSTSLWYRFRRAAASEGHPLRIGLLADSTGVESWLAERLAELDALPELEVTDVFEFASGTPASPPFLFQKFQQWSAAGAPDPFAPCCAYASSARRHTLTSTQSLTAGDRQLIADQQLDVLIYATSTDLTGDSTNLARWGVWSFLLGAEENLTHAPPYWREAQSGSSVSGIHLMAHDACFERARKIDSATVSSVQSVRFTGNRALPLKTAGTLLGRNLFKAAAGELRQSAGEISLSRGRLRYPSATTDVLPFIGTMLARSAFRRFTYSGRSLSWIIGIRQRNPTGRVNFADLTQGETFVELPTPEGHYYADPMLIEHDGRRWLFVEDFRQATNRASLACLEIRDDGGFTDPVTILDKPYHLSYPHAFLSNSEFFMIPESSDDQTVQLYRATKFPFEWTLEKVLMDGIALVDTTTLLLDGKWYFFTSTLPSDPEQGYLFTADSVDGAWQYHPANSIATDTRALRSAGALVNYDGRLIRPTQDCSELYGYAMTFNEVTRLSPTEFEERPVGRLGPTWAPNLMGTHSFAMDSRYELVDGFKAAPRT